MTDGQPRDPRIGDRHAADLGVLLLDANALTIPGAVSHPDSFGVTTTTITVDGVTATAITSPGNGGAPLEERYVRAATRLAHGGVDALTTNCGFTLPFQRALQRHTGLPVVSSALVLLPALVDVYGPGLGVLTYDTRVLGTLLEEAWDGHHVGTPTADVHGSAAWRALAEEPGAPVDVRAMHDDLVAVADAFADRHNLTALLLECTGFAPFAQALRVRLGLPVFDHITIVRFLFGARLQPVQVRSQEGEEGAANE